jgi:poly(A) polymerase
VSTFRAAQNAEDATDEHGRLLSDNVYGSQAEDAARRDFTINAMYYDPLTQTVVDYHGGFGDARGRLLRMIGDPETRYREDPVRIVRIVRFAAKLGFALDRATEAPIQRMLPLLANVPASRLFDEMVKLLQTGHAVKSVEELKKHGLDRGVFPVLEAALTGAKTNPVRQAFVLAALENTDRRVNEGRSVVPSFLLACLLWHDVQERWSALRAGGESAFPALQQAVDAVFEARIGDISGRGKLAADMREIWLMQPRFERRTVGSVPTLAAQPRFRAGYDFLRLRADVGEVPVELADWWEDYHLGDDEEREAMLQDLREKSHSRGGSRGTAPRRSGEAPAAAPVGRPEGEAESEGAEGEGDGGTSAPRKRRRRRRKPAAAAPAAGE